MAYIEIIRLGCRPMLWKRSWSKILNGTSASASH